MALVSIIMPAYNAKKYVRECLDGLLDQTFDDWELIAVDDGSTDQTPQILDRYAEKDSRIKVIHKNNGGVSSARNDGMAAACGQYIAFVDADDTVPKESLRIRADLSENADMVIAGYELFDENSVIERMPECNSDRWDTHEAVKNIFVSGEAGYQGYLWNKLFRNEILQTAAIRFRDGIAYNEDRLFCVEYAMHCSTVRLTNETVYRYRITPTNATSRLPQMSDAELTKFMSEFTAYDLMLETVKEKFDDCFYLGAVDAQYRAVRLKRTVNRQAKGLRKALNQQIRKYGAIALKAPLRYVGLRKKASVLGHMIMLR